MKQEIKNKRRLDKLRKSVPIREAMMIVNKGKELIMTKKTDNCQLEVDEERGVLYVHSPQGITLVRVCQIPTEVARLHMIDVVYDRGLAAARKAVEEGLLRQKPTTRIP